MSDRNFSRRRRGMRFRPAGGLGHGQQQRPDQEATQARAEAVAGPTAPEKVYEHRHTHEIERAENIAAGLPPEGPREDQAPAAGKGKGNFREPNFETPAEVQEEQHFEPVAIKEQSRGLLDTIRTAATTLVTTMVR